jgi:heme-degrading monooxygenase HmoA
MRFARNVQFQIKEGKQKEFAGLFENEVLPMLRRQAGFQEEVTLLGPKGSRAISLWDDEKSAEAYKTAAYSQVLAKLSTVIDGTPTVETYETATSYPRV